MCPSSGASDLTCRSYEAGFLRGSRTYKQIAPNGAFPRPPLNTTICCMKYPGERPRQPADQNICPTRVAKMKIAGNKNYSGTGIGWLTS